MSPHLRSNCSRIYSMSLLFSLLLSPPSSLLAPLFSLLGFPLLSASLLAASLLSALQLYSPFIANSSQTIQQMHHDIVFSTPPDVFTLGSSPRCAVQGMYLPQRLLTIQGHPEFDATIMNELLIMRHASGIFHEETFADGMRRAGDACDGVEVAAAMVTFLAESR